MRRTQENIGHLVAAGIWLITVAALVTFGFWVAATLFQYSFYTFTGKDVHWCLDLLGGIVLNGLNLPLAVICFILRSAGYEVPLIGE